MLHSEATVASGRIEAHEGVEKDLRSLKVCCLDVND